MIKEDEPWVNKKFPYAKKEGKVPANLMLLVENKRECPICGSEIKLELIEPWNHKKYTCKECVFALVLPGGE